MPNGLIKSQYLTTRYRQPSRFRRKCSSHMPNTTDCSRFLSASLLPVKVRQGTEIITAPHNSSDSPGRSSKQDVVYVHGRGQRVRQTYDRRLERGRNGTPRVCKYQPTYPVRLS